MDGYYRSILTAATYGGLIVPMETSDRLRAWFENARESLRYCPLDEIRVKFAATTHEWADVFVFGCFNEKIAVVQSDQSTESLVCSIDKPIAQIDFLKDKLTDKDNESFRFSAYCHLEEDFLEKIQSPKIALLSLAKNDVYTFPRFALGISDIAHSIRKSLRGSVQLYDLQLGGTINDFVQAVKNEKPDIIGISMTFGLFDIFEKVMDALSQEDLKCSIVVGGSLASLAFNEILEKYPNAIVSLSEGESFFLDFIDHLSTETNLEDIPSVAFVDQTSGTVIRTPSVTSRKIGLSIPELDLLIPTAKSKGVFQLETSRGCYNACSFCPREQKGTWSGSMDDIEQIEASVKYFCESLKCNGYEPSQFVIYVVDEEFVGGERWQERAVAISEVFAKHGLRYETSFRMNTIFSMRATRAQQEKKIKSVMNLRDSGLNRVLVGVESGVQSVLKRFNKNITSEENIMGIRLLTGLGIPVRFTYITFDPLMSFKELKETYFFQGRKDLILQPALQDEPQKLLDSAQKEVAVKKLAKGIPFYYEISYMLVSIECLIGSVYHDTVMKQDLGTDRVIKALGKREVNYLDHRIGRMSHYSQLWVDRNFAIDYSLKSLSKIYTGEEALNIRQQRILLKQHAYQLLGKFLFAIEQDERFLPNAGREEIKLMERLVSTHDTLDDLFLSILNHQFNLLVSEMDSVTSSLKKELLQEDYNNLLSQLKEWSSQQEWHLLHHV